MRQWQVLDRVDTSDGPLELRQRGERDFLITIAGRVLMTSLARRSEESLAHLACEAVRKQPSPRVLLGGLGMGYTLRAALDRLPAKAEVTVVDVNPAVLAWCRGPIALLTANAVGDRRVRVQIADVARVIAEAPAGHYDAVVLDLYEGPREKQRRRIDRLYGPTAVTRARRALRPGGVFAVWSEEADAAFEARFGAGGFRVTRHRAGTGGRTHVVYVGIAGRAAISGAASG